MKQEDMKWLMVVIGAAMGVAVMVGGAAILVEAATDHAVRMGIGHLCDAAPAACDPVINDALQGGIR